MPVAPRDIAGAFAIALVVLAAVAGIADYRARRRRDLDKVGLLDWRTVQAFALIAALIAAALYLHL